MASTSIVERLRSRTPVTFATPISVLIVSGLMVDTVSAVSSGLALGIVSAVLFLVFGYWLLTIIDRLWNMRALDASAGMAAWLALIAAMLGAGAVNGALSGDGRVPEAVISGVIAPVMAYFAVRELVRLRRTRRATREATATAS